MSLRILQEPAVEPVTLTEAKLHLRVDHSDEDGLIQGLIKLARQDVERMCTVALIEQSWSMALDYWPDRTFEIRLWPVASVDSISWRDSAGDAHVVDPSTYAVDLASRPARIALVGGANWPDGELYPLGAVSIQFTAGFGADGTAVPARYKQAMLLLIGHYYENREATLTGTGANVQLLPFGVTALLADDMAWAR